MKLLRLIENGLPSALEMLQLLLRKKELVMLAHYSSEHGIKFNEIFKAEKQETFAAGAGAKLAGKPYTVVEAKGDGFYSWDSPALGIGHGSPTVPVPNDSDEWDIDKFKLYAERPSIFVFGRTKVLDMIRNKKVTEAKALDDGRVMLKGGYYMVPDLPRPSKDHKSWTIKRLMDDDTVVATADVVTSDGASDYMFYMQTAANKNQVQLHFRAPSYKMMLDSFYDWVEKGMRYMIKEDQTHKPGEIVMLGNGFYLEADPRTEPSVRSFGIKRLMQDDEVGEAGIMGTEGDAWRGIWTMKVDGKKNSSRVGAESMLYNLKEFGEWVRKHLHEQLGEDLFADARKARQAKSNMDKPVYMRRLNKDGGESGLRDATTFHNTEAEAKAHHDQLVKNNPRQKIAHHMYSYNGDETFKTKFVGGKLVPLKGGIAGEPDIEDAVHDFIQMLDDEGSAAGIWMPYEQKEELYKLYKAKHKVKSTGLDTEDIDPDKIGARVDKKIKSLEAKGWKLFAKEENGDYVDMVFTKAP